MGTHPIPFNHYYLSVAKDQITHKTWLALNSAYLLADGSIPISGLLSFVKNLERRIAILDICLESCSCT